MAEVPFQVRHRQQQYATDQGDIRSRSSEKGPSTSQVVAVLTLFPIGGTLLLLAGLTLTGTLIGLAVATPLFVIFSPVLVPATLVIGLAVSGFLTSGAFGITALSWMANYLRRLQRPEDTDYLKRRPEDTAGERTKEAGQALQSKSHEGGRTREGERAHETGKT